ncbi:MAG: DEAD/DEAH box helicase, partial [Desulfobacterales bacterium]|nr:DEAD/DEAH box helicase [Desulfobacterales bacterium]
MVAKSKIAVFLDSLSHSKRLNADIAYRHTFSAARARWAAPTDPWPRSIENLLQSAGINALYRHQAQAIDLIRSGRHVMVATPTASGKTLVYDLPALEKFLADPDSTALYIFPLKALAQDQLQTFRMLAAHLKPHPPTAAIYDGDTSAYRRKQIRQAPPNLVMTTPEMLHLSLMAFHRKWAAFWSRLRMVVVDEVHSYRGVLGSHLSQIFRRFHRIAERYGHAGLPDDTIVIRASGTAGQSFGAWVAKGVTIDLSGEVTEIAEPFVENDEEQGGQQKGVGARPDEMVPVGDSCCFGAPGIHDHQTTSTPPELAHTVTESGCGHHATARNHRVRT